MREVCTDSERAAGLEHEWDTYKRLGESADVRALDFFEKDDFCVLVLPLMGLDLETLFEEVCDRSFSERTVLLIGDQLLHRLSKLHSFGIVHRDIKPANCALGVGTAGNKIHLIDLELSEDISNVGRASKPCETGDAYSWINGTARYASCSAFRGGGFSRFDDLESVAYMLIDFQRRLPWEDDWSLDRILKSKQNKHPAELCAGLAPEFAGLLSYALNRPSHKPDYAMCRRKLRNLFSRKAYRYDFTFDWTIVAYQRCLDEAEHSLFHSSTDSGETVSTEPEESASVEPRESSSTETGKSSSTEFEGWE